LLLLGGREATVPLRPGAADDLKPRHVGSSDGKQD
jgi:hypothetical protein